MCNNIPGKCWIWRFIFFYQRVFEEFYYFLFFIFFIWDNLKSYIDYLLKLWSTVADLIGNEVVHHVYSSFQSSMYQNLTFVFGGERRRMNGWMIALTNLFFFLNIKSPNLSNKISLAHFDMLMLFYSFVFEYMRVKCISYWWCNCHY